MKRRDYRQLEVRDANQTPVLVHKISLMNVKDKCIIFTLKYGGCVEWLYNDKASAHDAYSKITARLNKLNYDKNIYSR